jgi:protein-disulfide isomerase
MNKKRDKKIFSASKKSSLLLAGVAVLMLLSFLALQFKNKPKNGDVISLAEIDSLTTSEEKKINVSDIISKEDLASIVPVKEVDDGDHLLGSRDAKVKIVVYSDFECLYCAKFADTLALARSDFNDQISIVFRHFPLLESHPMAVLAAEASECASEQGKFWEMHDALFVIEKTSFLGRQEIAKAATQLQLDSVKFEECLDSHRYEKGIIDSVKQAKESTVFGAPTAFVNGELVTGANPYEDGTRSDGSKLEGLKNIITRHLNK